MQFFYGKKTTDIFKIKRMHFKNNGKFPNFYSLNYMKDMDT